MRKEQKQTIKALENTLKSIAERSVITNIYDGPSEKEIVEEATKTWIRAGMIQFGLREILFQTKLGFYNTNDSFIDFVFDSVELGYEYHKLGYEYDNETEYDVSDICGGYVDSEEIIVPTDTWCNNIWNDEYAKYRKSFYIITIRIPQLKGSYSIKLFCTLYDFMAIFRIINNGFKSFGVDPYDYDDCIHVHIDKGCLVQKEDAWHYDIKDVPFCVGSDILEGYIPIDMNWHSFKDYAKIMSMGEANLPEYIKH